MQRPSLVVLWRVTERCNLGCHFCRFSRELAGPRASVKTEEVLRFARLLGGLNRPVLVSWLGGEPLLWPPVIDASRALRDAGLQCGLTTHGGLGSAALWEKAARTLDRITFSLDGDRHVHDQVRQAPGLHERLRRNVTNLSGFRPAGRRPLIHVNTVLMRSNLALFEEICEIAASWGVDELTFNELGGRDRPGEFFERERLRPGDIEQLAGLLPGLRDRMAGHDLHILGSERYVARMAAAARGKATPVGECRPGQDFVFVDEAGRVAPCSFTTAQYGVPVGELVTAADLRGLPDRFAEMRRRVRAPVCDNCPSTQVHGKYDESI